MGTKEPRAYVDFESRSAGSLRKCGAWRYSQDPTTEVLCLGFRLPYWESERTALWRRGYEEPPELEELFEWVESGALIEAHNAWFEYCLWINVMQPRYGWPAVPSASWRCSAALAAAHALPRGLDKALVALGLPIAKDPAGAKLLKKTAKPRKPRKAELAAWEAAGQPLLWWEEEELLHQLWPYCRQDVLAEEALSAALPDLTPQEQRMFHMDLEINARGFLTDGEAVKVALDAIKAETAILTKELSDLTSGCPATITQRGKLLTWLTQQGVHLDDTQAETVATTLAQWKASEAPSPARRALEILQTLGRSSNAKYAAFQSWASPIDARVRGSLLYHGATTGRWTGVGVQPHNFPKGHIMDMEMVWRDLKLGTCASPMSSLSEALRGVIVTSPRMQLFVGDYAAIEARVLLWLAGDDLTLFDEGRDIYCEMASAIYGYPCSKANTPYERQVGKIAVLGLGYQMGATKFQATCAKYGISVDDQLAVGTVEAYREKFWRVKQLWRNMECAAVEAVFAVEYQTATALDAVVLPLGPGSAFHIRWIVEPPFLYAELPSGRRLAYPDPQLQQRITPWGAQQTVLSFMGVSPMNHQWQRQVTYGGMLVENLVQAIARDIMAEAMLRCHEGERYHPILSVHDEIVAEAVDGNLPEFEELLTRCPSWATGLPIAVEVFSGGRYAKH